MGKYSNPADKLSIIAQVPKSVLHDSVTIEQLSNASLEKQRANHSLSDDEKASWELCLNTRFSQIAAQREVPFTLQYKLLLRRNMIFTIRNPISIVFLVIMAAM